MKQIILPMLLLISISCSIAQDNADLKAINKELRAIEGKYVHDVDVFEIPIIQNRLKKLLSGKSYNEAQECLMTVTPYKIESSIFYFSGFSKLSYNACNIAIDLKQNVFHVKITYDESGEEKVFSENNELYDKLPANIMD